MNGAKKVGTVPKICGMVPKMYGRVPTVIFRNNPVSQSVPTNRQSDKQLGHIQRPK